MNRSLNAWSHHLFNYTIKHKFHFPKGENVESNHRVEEPLKDLLWEIFQILYINNYPHLL